MKYRICQIDKRSGKPDIPRNINLPVKSRIKGELILGNIEGNRNKRQDENYNREDTNRPAARR